MNNFTVSSASSLAQNTVSSHLEISLLTLINSVNSVMGFVGNVVVCILVFKFKFLRMRAEVLLGNLAVADMIVCVLAQPMYISYIHHINSFSPILNVVRKTITWMATLASLNNLFLISLDRFLAVIYLQRYRTTMTSMSLRIVLVATWAISFITGISTAFSRKAKLLTQYYVIIILVVVFLLHARTLFMMHGHAQRLRRRFKAELFQPRLLHLLSRERTLAKMIAVVVGAFYICFLPLVILPFFSFALRNSPAALGAVWRAFPWVNTLALCSSSINPYIYYWRSSRFRMFIRKLRIKN